MEKCLFISIRLSAEILEILESYGKKVRLENIRWIPKQNLHITLYFLGDVKKILIPTLIQSLQDLYLNTKPFILNFEKITFASPSRRASMIWAQFHKNLNYESLLKQTDAVVKKSLDINAQYNAKKLIPHVTMARFKTFINPQVFQLKQPQVPDFQVNSCELVESELNSNGSNYTTIEKFSFNKS